jgi:hypothetical protein
MAYDGNTQCIRQAYRSRKWSLIRNLVDARSSSACLAEVFSVPARRVTVGGGTEWWSEYPVSEAGPLGQLLRSPSIFDLLQYVIGAELSEQVTTWAQSYQVGERIPWHCDKEGEIQLLLCLQPTDLECGGQFCIRENGLQTSVDLSGGDAVLFKATALPHCTTRIVETGRTNPRMRVSAAARFFLADRTN